MPPPRGRTGLVDSKTFRNVERDRDTDRRLSEEGWIVIGYGSIKTLSQLPTRFAAQYLV